MPFDTKYQIPLKCFIIIRFTNVESQTTELLMHAVRSIQSNASLARPFRSLTVPDRHVESRIAINHPVLLYSPSRGC